MKKNLNKVFAFCMAIAMCMCTCLSTPALAMEARESTAVKSSNELKQVVFSSTDGKPLKNGISQTVYVGYDVKTIGYTVLPWQDNPNRFTVSIAVSYGDKYEITPLQADGKFHLINVSDWKMGGCNVTVRLTNIQLNVGSVSIVFGA